MRLNWVHSLLRVASTLMSRLVLNLRSEHSRATSLGMTGSTELPTLIFLHSFKQELRTVVDNLRSWSERRTFMRAIIFIPRVPQHYPRSQYIYNTHIMQGDFHRWLMKVIVYSSYIWRLILSQYNSSLWICTCKIGENSNMTTWNGVKMFELKNVSYRMVMSTLYISSSLLSWVVWMLGETMFSKGMAVHRIMALVRHGGSSSTIQSLCY